MHFKHAFKLHENTYKKNTFEIDFFAVSKIFELEKQPN